MKYYIDKAINYTVTGIYVLCMINGPSFTAWVGLSAIFLAIVGRSHIWHYIKTQYQYSKH
jgi:hypothetical protein